MIKTDTKTTLRHSRLEALLANFSYEQRELVERLESLDGLEPGRAIFIPSQEALERLLAINES